MSRMSGTFRRGAALAALVCGLSLAVVAGPAAAACPNDQFRTGLAAGLPGCRAYEQVSPVDKNGGDILHDTGGVFSASPGRGQAVAPNGEAAMIVSFGEFADIAYGSGTSENEYLSRRGAGGWETVSLIPRPSIGNAFSGIPISSVDLGRSLIESEALLTTDPLPGDGAKIYVEDNGSRLLTPIAGFPTGPQFVLPAASPDLGHVVFATWSVLTPDPGTPGPPTYKIYEFADGQLRLVSVRPDGTPFPSEALPAGGDQDSTRPSSTAGAVSDDGEHIFFSAQPVTEIYRRSHGTITELVSPSKRTPADPSGVKAKRFRVATSDGDRVLFTSSEHLTDDANTGPGRAGSDLYRYDVDADELVDISATAGGNGAQVQGVVGIDETAERVYYVANGVVVNTPGPGGQLPVAGQPNLYLWEDDGTPDGQTRFIATLLPSVGFPVTDPGDYRNWFHWDANKTSRTTGDGRYLVFQSKATIPGHDGGGGYQIYRYDADAGGTGDLLCVSCNPGGDAPVGPSIVTPSARNNVLWELSRVLSADGQRVFFSSRDSLVARDSNGKFDAYMWEGGEVYLLSSGTSSDDSYFYNAGADGDDAFFLTRDALVPHDGDDLLDLYDARVGGGFPAPAVDPDCSGEGCQGDPSGSPAADDPASEGLDGLGNLQRSPVLALRVSRLSRAQLARLARGRSVGLRVRVGRPGLVRAVVRARVADRRRVVAKGVRRASRAGTVTVRLQLSGAARRELRRSERLRLSVQVSGAGAPSRSLSFRIARGR